MKRRNFTISLAMAGWVPGAYAGPLAQKADSTAQSERRPRKTPRYKLVMLDSGAGDYSAAFALSNHGQAAGSLGFNIAGGYRPALFVPGQPAQPLYTDGPGQAQGINNRAEVVGWFRQGDVTQAFRWRKDRIDTLRSLGGGSGQALAINNRSEIVGWSEAAPGAAHAMYWWRDQWVDLGTWGGHGAKATALNEQGDIVGFREVPMDDSGRLFPQGVGQLHGQRPKLMPVPPGYDAVVPTSINERGAITGYVYRGTWIEGTRSVFVWADGQYRVMPFPNGLLTGGLSINNRGDVVGFNYDGPRDPRYVGMLWADRGQTPVSLQGAIDSADAAQWILMEAFALNNAGVAVGHGFYRPAPGVRTSTRAYMLIPDEA